MTSTPRVTQRKPHEYIEPTKRIHDGPDVQFFLQSLAYADITKFVLQLNRSLVPRKLSSDDTIRTFQLNNSQHEELLSPIARIKEVVAKLERLMADAPPDTGPRRFGNVSFRKWYKFAEDQAEDLLRQALPESLHVAVVELKAYLLGSFGSAQRLDYGTGHELSFLAFLACLWKLSYFEAANTTPKLGSSQSPSSPEEDSTSTVERQIALNLFQPYLTLVRSLIIIYNLEPAGSHGVWGLDDNSFLPYMFGSAQYCPAILEDTGASDPVPTPTSGSLPSSPEPNIVTKQNLVEKESASNLYFGAINFIYTVKRGPFWEHSPMLFDISGIKDGWGKINKGMIKMYDAEVLSKFPVVQHFPFGNLLKWERDPQARPVVSSTHTANQPLRDPLAGGSNNATAMRPLGPGGGAGTAASWGMGGASVPARPRPAPSGFVNGATQAPWAKHTGNRTTGFRTAPAAPNPRISNRIAPPRPVHPQESLPPGAENDPYMTARSLHDPGPGPVSAATQVETQLTEKTPETIPE